MSKTSIKPSLNNSNKVKTLTKMVECNFSPVDLFKQLQQQDDRSGRILLESSEIDSKQQLKSILLNKAALRIVCEGNRVTINAVSHNGKNALIYLAEVFDRSIDTREPDSWCIKIEYPENTQTNQDEETRLKRMTPIDSLRTIHRAFKSEQGNQYSVFLAGLFSFDLIATFENLPKVKQGINTCPDFVFYLAEDLVVFDHQFQRASIVTNVFSGHESQKHYFEQSRRIQQTEETISGLKKHSNSIRNAPPTSKQKLLLDKVECDLSDQQYCDIVTNLKQEIVAGNIFQVVPSRSFSIPCSDEVLSYQKLKETNPSPYMFFMQDQDFSIFGASPESALKFNSKDRKVDLYPIAGTRQRGKFPDGSIDHDLDKRYETDLKLDQKEISEHLMLVDLARNDIARISDSGSVFIPRLLEIDRYSQVMHLVSCVEGKLNNDLDCFHAYQACMNMGTLTGAPKIKASSLVRLTEKTRRGSYGGAVGYINTDGDMDTCIVIRSAYFKDSVAHVQAGAGIVYDSVPQLEAEETRNKANAVLLAISMANEEIRQNGDSNE